ncbi:LuxR C-terminal-related transcriptional regulator [Jiella sp. M17.18]|uniref:LuxR C-terminal-related transcriptional regulator n=1 Tax=Jiella sp. M17.18 TaxID=3234247 RepID=UPI0034DE257F
MSNRIAVAISEVNALLRDGIASLLREDDYVVVAAVADNAAVDARTADAPGQILFLLGEDAARGGFDLETVSRLRTRHPQCYIVMLVTSYSNEQRSAAEDAGVNGVLVKSISREALLRGIDLIVMGEQVFSPTTRRSVAEDGAAPVGAGACDTQTKPSARALPDPTLAGARAGSPSAAGTSEADRTAVKLLRRENLSAREMEILKCLISGDSNKVIARRCSITESTVKVHLKAILRKIRVANRTQAAVWAMNKMRAEGRDVPAAPPERPALANADTRRSNGALPRGLEPASNWPDPMRDDLLPHAVVRPLQAVRMEH